MTLVRVPRFQWYTCSHEPSHFYGALCNSYNISGFVQDIIAETSGGVGSVCPFWQSDTVMRCSVETTPKVVRTSRSFLLLSLISALPAELSITTLSWEGCLAATSVCSLIDRLDLVDLAGWANVPFLPHHTMCVPPALPRTEEDRSSVKDIRVLHSSARTSKQAPKVQIFLISKSYLGFPHLAPA